MALSEEELYKGEKVILEIRPHLWFLVPQLSALIGSAVLGVALSVLTQDALVTMACVALIMLVLAWLLMRYIVWNTTVMVLTTDRLMSRIGVFRRQGTDIPLERINTVFFSQTLFERALGLGDLQVESAGERGNQTFPNIAKPLAVQNEIYQQMESNENRKFVKPPVTAGSDSPTTVFQHTSIPQQIGELDRLRQQGILTEEEFTAKKTELLGRM